MQNEQQRRKLLWILAISCAGGLSGCDQPGGTAPLGSWTGTELSFFLNANGAARINTGGNRWEGTFAYTPGRPQGESTLVFHLSKDGRNVTRRYNVTFLSHDRIKLTLSELTIQGRASEPRRVRQHILERAGA